MPATYNIPTLVRGDHWRGLLLQLTTGTNEETQTPRDLTGATIRMQLRARPEGETIYAEWSTNDGTVSITDAEAGEFSIIGRRMDVPAIRYYYDLEFTFPGFEDRQTYITGRWDITQDITR
jgi:hypothetical protein